jgi:hypothetical protein
MTELRFDLPDSLVDTIAERAAALVLERLDGRTGQPELLSVPEAADCFAALASGSVTAVRRPTRAVEGRLARARETGRSGCPPVACRVANPHGKGRSTLSGK